MIDNCDIMRTCLPTSWASTGSEGLTNTNIIIATWLTGATGVLILVSFFTYLWWCGKRFFYKDDFEDIANIKEAS